MGFGRLARECCLNVFYVLKKKIKNIYLLRSLRFTVRKRERCLLWRVVGVRRKRSGRRRFDLLGTSDGGGPLSHQRDRFEIPERALRFLRILRTRTGRLVRSRLYGCENETRGYARLFFYFRNNRPSSGFISQPRRARRLSSKTLLSSCNPRQPDYITQCLQQCPGDHRRWTPAVFSVF